MPELTIPLFGLSTSRGGSFFSAGKDSRYIGTLFDVVSDELSGSRTVFIKKRFGLSAVNTPAAGSVGTAVFRSLGDSGVVSAFGASNSTIFYNTTNCGTISGLSGKITDTILNGIVHYLIVSNDGTGWYLPQDAASDATPTFTADTTSGSAVLTNVSSVTNVYVGQLLSGTGIPALRRVQSIDSATQITMTNTASANGAGVTVTFERVAKIIDADFPSTATGSFQQMNGRLFVGTTNGRIYNSDINSVTSWAADNYISADDYSDGSVFCVRNGQYILAMGSGSIEFFSYSGNPSGSPLVRAFSRLVGCSKNPATLRDGIFFVSPQYGTTAGIWSIYGNEIKKISTPEIDGFITSGNDVYAFELDGQDYVFTTLNSSPIRSFLCNLSIGGIWTESGFSSSNLIASGIGMRFVDSVATNGIVYTIDTNTSPVYQDNGSSYTMTVQTEPKFLNGGKPFIIDWLDVICDTQASGSSTVSASGDDYASFDTLGTIDLTSQLKRIQPGGRYESSVAFKLTDAGNQAWRGQALKVHWTPCQ